MDKYKKEVDMDQKLEKKSCFKMSHNIICSNNNPIVIVNHVPYKEVIQCKINKYRKSDLKQELIQEPDDSLLSTNQDFSHAVKNENQEEVDFNNWSQKSDFKQELKQELDDGLLSTNEDALHAIKNENQEEVDFINCSKISTERDWSVKVEPKQEPYNTAWYVNPYDLQVVKDEVPEDMDFNKETPMNYGSLKIEELKQEYDNDYSSFSNTEHHSQGNDSANKGMADLQILSEEYESVKEEQLEEKCAIHEIDLDIKGDSIHFTEDGNQLDFQEDKQFPYNDAAVSLMDEKKNINVKITQPKEYDLNKNSKNCFKCDLCQYTTFWRWSLKRHINSKHTRDSLRKCNFCDYTACEKDHLMHHIRSKHTKEDLLQCDFCVYTTSRKEHLKGHINSKHTKEGLYKCNYCGYTSDQKGNLQRHIDSIHTNFFKCDHCDFISGRKDSLKKHINSKHIKNSLLKCDFCAHTSFRKDNLKQHINSKHKRDNWVRCDFCDYATSRKDTLKSHISKHHTGEGLVKCEYCAYSTYRNDKLNIHINNKHTRERLHQCDHCDYATYQKVTLKKHINSKHTRDSVHHCDYCKYTTCRKDDLNKHVKKQHSMELTRSDSTTIFK